MTSLRNVQLSDSTVYREIYQKPREHALLRENRRGAAEETNSKWAFLKRLLEIEEEHDKRRKARERQERAFKQATVNRVTPNDRLQAASRNMQIDHLDKWFNGQVLTTEPDVDNTEPEQEESSSHRLPPVIGNMSPNTSRSSPEPSHHHAMRAPSKSPIENQHSLFSKTETNVGGDDKREQFSNSNQHVSLSNLKTNSHPNFIRLSEETQTSLNSFQREQSRLASAPKKRRQLRLPPILLPRVYTVKPRPLKALEFPEPTALPGPITETQWEDLWDCRYIRHATPRAKKSLNLKD